LGRIRTHLSVQTTHPRKSQAQPSYQFGWFDRFCLWYPPAWLILFNRHWQHYKPDPDGWRWSEYGLFLLPGGFYLALILRWLRVTIKRWFNPPLPDSNNGVKFGKRSHSSVQADQVYQQAFRDEILAPIVTRYFRAELHHAEALPETAPLLITINHAGMCFPWDFLSLAWLLSERQGWFVQPLAHPLFFDHPWLRWWLPEGWAETLGGVRAEVSHFEAAIAHNTVMIYAPEGWRGLAKGWQQRYHLEKFDPSFVRLSVRHQTPVLPVLCLGNEKLHPFAFNVRWLARLVKMPMFPLSPLIPVFVLFPSMGIWAVRTRLRYCLQPVWHPWTDPLLQTSSGSKRLKFHRLAQTLRSRLQASLNLLVQRRE